MSAVQGAHAAVHPATVASMIASMAGVWQIVARTATTEAMVARGEYDALLAHSVTQTYRLQIAHERLFPTYITLIHSYCSYVTNDARCIAHAQIRVDGQQQRKRRREPLRTSQS